MWSIVLPALGRASAESWKCSWIGSGWSAGHFPHATVSGVSPTLPPMCAIPVPRPLDVGHSQVKVVERLSQLRTRRAPRRQQQQKRQGSGQEEPRFHGRTLTHTCVGAADRDGFCPRPEGLQLLCKGSGPSVAGSLQASGASASTGLWRSEGQHVLRRPVTAAHVAPKDMPVVRRP